MAKIAKREIIPYHWLEDARAGDIHVLAACSDKQLRAMRRMWPNDGAPLPTVPDDQWLNEDGTACYPAGFVA